MTVRIARTLSGLLLGVLVCLNTSAMAANLLANADFEIPPPAAGAPPAGWKPVGDGTMMIPDPAVRNGKSGAGVQMKTGTTFGGIGQSVDAKALHGKVVVFSAWLKAQDVGTGTSGIWMRGDGDTRRAIQFGHSYDNPVRGTSDWTQRSLRMLVTPDISSIHVGMALGANGTLHIDDASLTLAERGEAGKRSTIAQQYLDQAIANIRNAALNRDKVDWTTTLASIDMLAAGAETPADTHAAIRYALSALDDRHSRLVAPSSAKSQSANSRTDDFGIVSQSLAGMGYVKVPTYGGGAPVRNDAFSTDLKSRLAALQSENVCGWIVDLRGNGGGNMWPMLRGLQPLLGETVVGYFVAPTQKTAWKLDAATAQTVAVADFLAHKRDSAPVAPVAILQGPKTSSSGEAVAVSFIGRPVTQSFGQPTAGLSTSNASIPLADGALMLLTTAVFADRTGKTYGERIQPDVSVEEAKSATGLNDDPVVQAALTWLKGTATCKRT